MTIHPLSAGEGYRYLTRSIASGDQQRGLDGLVDYYALSGLPPGRWFGQGCEGLGLAETVAEDDMRALFGAGVDPHTGERLGRAFPTYSGQQQHAVSGYDLTFSPVKSVSVFWALTEDDHERHEVHAAHRAAVEETLSWLEAEAAFTRTGAGGVMQVDVAGLTVACFDHWESRCGDPDLHTHAVVSAKVQGLDGKWRALDSQAMHHAVVAASEKYNTRLEGQLIARLGVEFADRSGTGGNGREPVRELAGVPDVLIGQFSSRGKQIRGLLKEFADNYRESSGREPTEAMLQHFSEVAVLQDRPGKHQEPRPLPMSRRAWREKAAVGLGGVAGRGRAADGFDVGRVGAEVLAKVEARRATFVRWHVEAEAERAVRRSGVGVAEQPAAVGAVVGDVLARSLSLAAPEVGEVPVELRRRDGQSVFDKHAAARFTTARTLDAEESLVAAARTGGARTVSAGLAEAVLALRDVSAEQADAVRRLACEDRALDLLVGPAGTGKTTTLAALVDVWTAGGGTVLGLAPSAAAAAVLAAETGIATENVAKWLHETAKPVTAIGWAMRLGQLVLVDEASMAGTHDLDALRRQAEAADAKLVLIGDPRQLSAVGAGGAMRLLEAEVGGAHLAEAWRFRAGWEREAAAALRVGDPDVVAAYAEHGRLADGPATAMVEAAFRGWQADVTAGRSAVLVTSSAQDVSVLSQRAREFRVDAGQVEANGVPLRTGSRAGVGDHVVTRANDRRATVNAGRDFVKNGDCWQVRGRHGDGALDVRHTVHGGTVTLPAAYVAAHVELAYAATVHRAEGMTVDVGHLLVTPEMTREAAYVGMTRGREENRAYVVTLRVDVESEHRPAQVLTRDEVLGAVLAREGAERGATETLREELARAESLDVLVPRYEAAAARAAQDRLRGALTAVVGSERAADVLADPAWSALSRALGERESAGQSAREVLARVAAARELDTAGSVAQVLFHRLDREPPPERAEPVPASALAGPGSMRDYLTAYETAIADRRVETLVPDTAAEVTPELAPMPSAERPAVALASAAAEAPPSYAEQITALRARLAATPAPTPAPEARRDDWSNLHGSHDRDLYRGLSR